MAWQELPLIIFTVLAQTSVGAFLVCGALILTHQLSDQEHQRLHKAMFFLWGLMVIAFGASTLHLGSPFRAINALNRVGSSWLSNEIFTGSLFFACGGFYWLLEVLNKGSKSIRTGLMIATMLIALIFMFSMIKVYLINTVPTWDTIYTPLGFLLTVIISGSIFAYLLLSYAVRREHLLIQCLPKLAMVGVFISCITSITQMVELNHIHSAIVSALDLVPDMAMLMIIRYCLLFVGLALSVKSKLIRECHCKILLISFILILLSELIGRSIFYGLHMTIGM